MNIFTSPASQVLPGTATSLLPKWQWRGKESLFGSWAVPRISVASGRATLFLCVGRGDALVMGQLHGCAPLAGAQKGECVVNAWLLLFLNSYFEQETLHFQFAPGPASDTASPVGSRSHSCWGHEVCIPHHSLWGLSADLAAG